ncbi:MAG TPA: N-glycosylase/DNA lyase [Methanothermococcus okinawensis]|uniref:N-glycosylase/DNA lyase n=1 Tax=Methanothermococcus okinawensis TaxID=155863 RepID=A0A833E5Z6_9EURY|nr:N-glycosylase/DNA lyase [Methanothermococcus okinawensis]
MTEDRVNKLKYIIKSLGIESARLIEEKIDLQYHYLKNLKERLNNQELFLKLIILNALVSYQLSTTGENWWREFSEYPWENISGDVVEEYIKFLSNSKGNRRYLDKKIKRINKLKYFLSTRSLEDFKNYYNNMEALRKALAKVLNTKGHSKTVVFAVKIFGYGARMSFNRFIPYPYSIEIPRDSRIEKYTAKFTRGDVLKFWSEVARDSGVPPLHIDSILWPALGDWERVKKPLKALSEDVYKKVKMLIELAK